MTDTTSATIEEPARYTILTNEPEPEAAAEPEPSAEEATSEPEQPEKKKHDANERIRQLNERTKAAEAETARLRAELEAKANPPTQTDRPKPEDFVGGRYSDAYLDALEAWRDSQIEKQVNEKLTKREQEAKQREQQAKLESEKEKVIKKEVEFIADHPDYDDVLQQVFDRQIIVKGDGIADALIDMENGIELAYQIGSNPELLEEFESLTPTQRLIRIGQMSAQSTTAPAKPTARVSKAAPPITPLSGGGTAVTGQAAIEAAEKSGNYDAWLAAKKAAQK